METKTIIRSSGYRHYGVYCECGFKHENMTMKFAQELRDLHVCKNPAAIALGTLGGKAKSEKKTKAARENGKKGGRPKKTVDNLQALPKDL